MKFRILLIGALTATGVLIPASSQAVVNWSGTVALSASASRVDSSNPTATVTVRVSTPMPTPYAAGIYDELGRVVVVCKHPMQVCSAVVTIPFGSTKTYTAYISMDHPPTGPPTSVLRTAGPASITHLGWHDTMQFAASAPTVDSSNPTATLTLSESAPIPWGYAQVIYDESNQRVGLCTYPTVQGCSTPVTIPFEATKTYTAYISLDYPTTGPPADVYRTAGSVSITHLGWLGTAQFSASTSTVDSSNPTATLTLSESAPIPSGYAQAIYDESNHLVALCTYPTVQGCSTPVTIPFEATKTYTAYISTDYPATGPPTNVLRSAGSATVTNVGYVGALTLTTPNSVADNVPITVTAAAVPAPGSPYTVSIYRADTGQRLTTCSGTCSVTLAAPADGTYYTLAAYVATDAPATSLPTQNVDRSAALTVSSASSNVSDYAVLLAPYVAQHSIDEFCVEVAAIPQPHTEESGTPGVFGAACLSGEAAGMTLPEILKLMMLAAGTEGGGALLTMVLDRILTETGSADPTAPHQVPDLQAPPSPTPGGLPSGPDDQLLDLMKARRQGPAGQPWTDAALKTVVQQCRDLMAQYGGALAPDGSQRCDNTPLLVPSAYDAAGPTANDLAGIMRNPAWLLLHYVSNAVKPRTSPGWYDTAAYEPNPCTDRPKFDADGEPIQCDEFPFWSSAEGGADNVRATTSPRPSLAPVLGTENVLEGQLLGTMYRVCRLQSGATPTDQSVPESEYLVIPIPWKELGVPTGFLC